MDKTSWTNSRVEMVSCCISNDRTIIIKWEPGGFGSGSYFYLYKFMCTDTYIQKINLNSSWLALLLRVEYAHKEMNIL